MFESAAARFTSDPSDRYRVTKPNSASTKRRSRSLDDSAEKRTTPVAKCHEHYLPSPSSSELNARKRKRDDQQDERGNSIVCEPRTMKSMPDTTYIEPHEQYNSLTDQNDLVGHWLENDFKWANILRKTATAMDNRRGGRASKRSLSRSNSWRQTTISGNTPRAWCREYGAIVEERGIFMDVQEGITIAEDDKQLCEKILDANYQLPEEWRFQQDNFVKILKLVKFKNECRVVRDLGPHLMPSPELLNAQGHPGLENIAEGVDDQWGKCESLYGPKSTPDASHGISRFLFNSTEHEKLTANYTCTCETMMFPFYISEGGCFDKSIEESELQALHSASVASNTVIQLYKKIGAEKELDRRVLAFSLSHNQRQVKIFGHFASINDDTRITFHRHQIFGTDLINDTLHRTRPYQIALGIWEHFFPIHLARVRDALARQLDRAPETFAAQVELEDSGSKVSTTVSTPQDNSEALIKLQEDLVTSLNTLREQQENNDREQERLREKHHTEQERLREEHRTEQDRLFTENYGQGLRLEEQQKEQERLQEEYRQATIGLQEQLVRLSDTLREQQENSSREQERLRKEQEQLREEHRQEREESRKYQMELHALLKQSISSRQEI